MGAHGFELAFERARERLRGKVESIKSEVEPKRLEKIEVVTTENVGTCGKYLEDKKECPGMSSAFNAGLCERCGFYQKVRPTGPIKGVSTASVGLERVARKIGEDEHPWECYDCGYRWKGSPCYYRPICPRCESEEIAMVRE